MAKKLHLVHVKSNVLNRAPSASTINYGEIAVNYNADSPALYIRDNADNIVKFISEPYFLKIVGTGVTENDNETITPISEIIQQDEETVAAALNDLNDRKADKEYVDEAVSGITIDADSELDSASTNPVENRVITAALGNISDAVDTCITGLTPSGTGNVVTSLTKNGNEIVVGMGEVDISGAITGVTSVTASAATKFVSEIAKDGQNVKATLVDIDSELSTSSTRPVQNQAITKMILKDEKVTALALNDLNDRKADSATFNTHTGTTVASRTSSQMHLPAVSASDNGKILRVVNGEWALVDPATIYSGSGTPAQSLGNDGDIYLQTS